MASIFQYLRGLFPGYEEPKPRRRLPKVKGLKPPKFTQNLEQRVQEPEPKVSFIGHVPDDIAPKITEYPKWYRESLEKLQKWRINPGLQGEIAKQVEPKKLVCYPFIISFR